MIHIEKLTSIRAVLLPFVAYLLTLPHSLLSNEDFTLVSGSEMGRLRASSQI
jgi:hypothetical protein